MTLPSLIAVLGFLATINLVISQDVFQEARPHDCCVEYCFSSDYDRSQVKRFSTKTAYDFVKQPNSESFFAIPNCEPTKFWMLARHGTRLPTAKSIEEMQKLTNERDEVIKNYEMRRSKPDRGPLCIQDLDLLRNWRWDSNITTATAEYLTSQGWNDMKYLAINYRHSFPRLLNNIYEPNEFYFRFTNAQRTEASFKGFVEGLFGERAYDHIRTDEAPKQDFLLQPYDQCPAWKKTKDAEIDENSEVYKFEQLPIFVDMVSDVSTRMGFKYTLTTKQILTLWDICRYEQAWFITKLSPWCTVFNKAQVDILEYREDLTYYYQSGHGNDLNEKIPCEIIKDLLTRMNSTENPKTIAYFAHDALIQTMLVGLGVYKDIDPLRASNFEFLKRNRQWRTSQLAPFGANIIAVKYDCPNERVRDKITMYINEKPVHFQWCNVGLCDLEKFQFNYKQFLEVDCKEYFCQENSANSLLIKYSTLGLILLQFCLVLLRN